MPISKEPSSAITDRQLVRKLAVAIFVKLTLLVGLFFLIHADNNPAPVSHNTIATHFGTQDK